MSDKSSPNFAFHHPDPQEAPMGGNLFHLGRLPRGPYLHLESRLRPLLDELFGDQWRIPYVHTDKADFGDLDVLVSRAALTPDAVQAFAVRTGTTQTKRTGRVYSHALPLQEGERSGEQTHFQVDLFGTPEPELQVRHDFMSWGDLGNILGRMVRRWNLKWGEDGLVYVHRREHDEHYRAELKLSSNIHDVLRLLELDPAVHARGFTNETEMFEWIVKSPHFSPLPYQQTEGKFKDKAKKRAGMQRFTQFVAGRSSPERPPRPERHEVQVLFPDAPLMAWLDTQDRQAGISQRRKEKFSGTRVMQLRPELQGKALGAFITALRDTPVGLQTFDDWVLDQAQDVIDQHIAAFQVSL